MRRFRSGEYEVICSPGVHVVLVDVELGAGELSPSVGEAADVAPLPGGFDGTGVVVLAHEVHRLAGRYSVQDGETGQGRAGSATATAAGDLDAFDAGTSPCLTQDGLGLAVTAGQPEVRPAQPLDLPGGLGRPPAEQVDGEGRRRTGRNRSAKRSATDQAPGGKPQDTRVIRVPSLGHPLTVVAARARGACRKSIRRSTEVTTFEDSGAGPRRRMIVLTTSTGRAPRTVHDRQEHVRWASRRRSTASSSGRR